MISETLISTMLITLVFLSGTIVGQLILKLRLAKIEKENLILEQKRVMDLKSILRVKSGSKRKRRSSSDMDQLVRDEIDDIIDDIEDQ